jgi:hypothetical protein
LYNLNKQITQLGDLKSFFDQLSISAYEGLYSLSPPDIDSCEQDLLNDLFIEK